MADQKISDSATVVFKPTLLIPAVDLSLTPGEQNVNVTASSLASATGQGGAYIVAGFGQGGPLAAKQIIFGHRFAAGVTFPANFGGIAQGPAASGGCFIAAAGVTALTVEQCAAAADPTAPGSWRTIGTMTLSAGYTVAFATTGGEAQVCFAGDYMRWVGPATPDPTMAFFFASLAASRN